MANIKSGKVLVLDTAEEAILSGATIQAIFSPKGTTETCTIKSNGVAIFNTTFSATIDTMITFPFGLTIGELGLDKSATTAKIYIYLR